MFQRLLERIQMDQLHTLPIKDLEYATLRIESLHSRGSSFLICGLLAKNQDICMGEYYGSKSKVCPQLQLLQLPEHRCKAFQLVVLMVTHNLEFINSLQNQSAILKCNYGYAFGYDH
ncbi:hypothetical protein Scep_024101 [Stephania cephalantha]|uniref:Uncharacterized protein n=1 Tax=Stephania cephalantha TaxID=152367 RepID=A0AAP0EVX7_9MAGN